MVYAERKDEVEIAGYSAAVFDIAAGFQQMSIFMTLPTWSVPSEVVRTVALHWVTRGLFVGFRRAVVNAHVDDLFLKSYIDVQGDQDYEYRSTSGDIQCILEWQQDLHTRLAPGSNFKLEMAFNGNGPAQAIASPTAVYYDNFNSTATAVSTDWIKPLDTGRSVWPPLPLDSALWNRTSIQDLLQDELLDFLWEHKDDIYPQFFWVSHTFSHLNLNNATYDDAVREVMYNQQFAQKVLEVYDEVVFSSNVLVTPEISGTRNGDALTAISDAGISAVVGDSSRLGFMINSTAAFLAPWTTMASSNYNGMLIIPRQPTEIYFESSTVEEDTYLYAQLRQKTRSWEEILARESERIVMFKLMMNMDSYMFHQANLRCDKALKKKTYGGSERTYPILAQWVEEVAMKLANYTTWPMVSVKLDDMRQYYLD